MPGAASLSTSAGSGVTLSSVLPSLKSIRKVLTYSAGLSRAWQRLSWTVGIDQQRDAPLQAALGLYAEFDIYSGCKLGSTEAAGTALTMVYSSDGTQLYVLTAVSAMHMCRWIWWLHQNLLIVITIAAYDFPLALYCRCFAGPEPLHNISTLMEEESPVATA